jgi:amidase
MESLGHTVEPDSPDALADPDISQAFLPCYGAWTAQQLDLYGEVLGRPLTAADVEAATWAVAEMGRGVSATRFVAGLSAIHQYSARVLHRTPGGLPVGVQPVAAYGREDLLLRVASQLEQACPWSDRRPRVHA